MPGVSEYILAREVFNQFINTGYNHFLERKEPVTYAEEIHRLFDEIPSVSEQIKTKHPIQARNYQLGKCVYALNFSYDVLLKDQMLRRNYPVEQYLRNANKPSIYLGFGMR